MLMKNRMIVPVLRGLRLFKCPLVLALALGLSQAHAASVTLQQTLTSPPGEEILGAIEAMSVHPQGGIILADSRNGALVRFDDAGQPTVLSLSQDSNFFTSSRLMGVASLGEDTFAVSNRSDNKILILNSNREILSQFGDGGQEQGRINEPLGVYFSGNRRLYVADYYNNRVSVFGPDGVFIRTIGADKENRLDSPKQIAVDRQERVYVYEVSRSGSIAIYQHDGTLIQRFDNRQLQTISRNTDLKVTAMTVDPKTGLLYFADSNNGRIYQFDWEQQTILNAFGTKGSQRGQFAKIAALLLLPDNRLAVADAENRKIELYQIPATGHASLKQRLLPTIEQGPRNKIECNQAYRAEGEEFWCLDEDNDTVRRVTQKSGETRFKLEGEFDDPKAAAFDAQRVAVIDGDKLKIYGRDGKLQFSSGTNRSGGNDPLGFSTNNFSSSTEGKFHSPRDVYLRHDRVYVVDEGNRRVQIFSPDGLYLDKIANPEEGEPLFDEPVSLAVDSRQNIFVADRELKRVLVFDRNKQLAHTITGGTSDDQRFENLFDLEVDADDNLYVLCSTPGNRATVQVYKEGQLIFSFAARTDDPAGLDEPSNLSILPDPKTIVGIYDPEKEQLAAYKYIQVPPPVADVDLTGGLEGTRLVWRSVPGNYVVNYRIYGATSDDSPYELLAESREPHTFLEKQADKEILLYKVSAISAFGLEGDASEPVPDRFRLAQNRFENGNYDEAADILARVFEEQPSHADTVKYLGLSLMELERYYDAQRYFEILTTLPERENEGLRLQVKALRLAGDDVAAKNIVNRVIEAGGADFDTYLACGDISVALKDAIGAVECLEQALALNPDSIDAHLLMAQAYIGLGITDDSKKELEAARAIDPENPEAWRRSAIIEQSLGNDAASVALLERAIELDPDDLGSKVLLARTHMKLEQRDAARNIALQLTGHDETAGEGNYLLGIISLAEQETGRGLIYLNKATRADPTHFAAWLELSRAYRELDKPDKAYEPLQMAAQNGPKSFEAQWALGQYEFQQGRYDLAANALTRAVLADEEHYDARFMLAQSHYNNNELMEALEHAKVASNLADESATEALSLLARVSARQGKNAAAINYLKQALERQSDSYELTIQLAELYINNNFFDEATQSLERAAVIDGSRPESPTLLGKLYLKRRLFDKAIAALDEAVKLAPTADNKLLLESAYAEKKKSLEFKSNAPQIVLKDLQLKPIFSAAYKQYANQPIGSIRVTNLGELDYGNLDVTFTIKGYMDFPTSTKLEELKANSTVDVPLSAAFNNRVLEIDEDTGVQVEVALNYVRDGRDDAITLTQPITIYGKNAILWANADMMGSFVTPKDDLVRDFVRESINTYKPEPGPMNANLVSAMTVFNIFSGHGIRYVVDPNAPYSKLADNQVDYVQFSRETLKIRSGDCDDLTVLFSAALENLGIETAALDVPGHLLMMFNTGLPASERSRISLQDDLMAIRNDQVWIPLEVTMVGTSFSEAWTEGARKYQQYSQSGELNVIELREVWNSYQPVTLKPANYTLSIPQQSTVQPEVEREYSFLLEKSLARLVEPYRIMAQLNPNDQEPVMQMAIIYARNGLYEKAFRLFDELLKENPENSAVFNNRGNIYFARGEMERALKSYGFAEQYAPEDAGVKINLAMTHYQMGQLDEARVKFNEAKSIDGDTAEQYDAFAKMLNN